MNVYWNKGTEHPVKGKEQGQKVAHFCRGQPGAGERKQQSCGPGGYVKAEKKKVTSIDLLLYFNTCTLSHLVSMTTM